MKTKEELQEIAYKIACAAKPNANTAKALPTGSGAIYNYWKEHKTVGVPYTAEYDVTEGGKALVTSTGVILYWDGSSVSEI